MGSYIFGEDVINCICRLIDVDKLVRGREEFRMKPEALVHISNHIEGSSLGWKGGCGLHSESGSSTVK